VPASPGAANSGPTAETRQGFQLLRWIHGGMEYIAISDAEAGELAQLRAALVAKD